MSSTATEEVRVKFGTDGIRGPIGHPPITPDFFNIIGQACYTWLTRKGMPAKVAIGWDTRNSGETLAEAFAAGFGIYTSDITLLGVTPTPAIAFYVSQTQCSLGVSITASHNPYTDNGLKLFRHTGSKLSVEEEKEIEALCLHLQAIIDNAKPLCQHINGSALYLNHFRNTLKADVLRGRKIVLDTANGATTYTTLPLLQYLGAEVIPIGHQPNGSNINQNCGSEHSDLLQKTVQAQKAWLGFAHDGDGDRIIVVDESGDRMDGDQVLGLLALDMQQQGKLKNATVVVTEQSNSGLTQSLQRYGIRTITCPVGDRAVYYAMEACDSNLGGENSGHIVLKDEALTGDGLRVVLKLIDLAQTIALKERKKAIHLLPKCESFLYVNEKWPLAQLEQLQALYHRFKKDSGRIHIRYSGTENKLRFLVEAPTQDLCEQWMEDLKSAARVDFDRLKSRGTR